jgi:hypothetical protein
VRSPVRDQQWSDRHLNAQLFADLADVADSGLSGCLSGLHVPAGDVTVVLVRGLDEKDPACLVREENRTPAAT